MKGTGASEPGSPIPSFVKDLKSLPAFSYIRVTRFVIIQMYHSVIQVPFVI